MLAVIDVNSTCFADSCVRVPSLEKRYVAAAKASKWVSCRYISGVEASSPYAPCLEVYYDVETGLLVSAVSIAPSPLIDLFATLFPVQTTVGDSSLQVYVLS